MKRLEDLAPDRREWAIDLAIAIACEPEPIEGLSRAESTLVHVVKAAKGKVVLRDHLAQAGCRDEANPPLAKVIDVRLWKISEKRPDIYALLERVWGRGIRWRDPSVEIPVRKPGGAS